MEPLELNEGKADQTEGPNISAIPDVKAKEKRRKIKLTQKLTKLTQAYSFFSKKLKQEFASKETKFQSFDKNKIAI